MLGLNGAIKNWHIFNVIDMRLGKYRLFTLAKEKPTVAELIELSLEKKGMSQKQPAGEIGISPSSVNDYLSGHSEPTLKIARLLCRVLNIPPAAILGF